MISISDEQADGTIWILSGLGAHKTLSKVQVSNGRIVTSENVSSGASAVTQSQNGRLVLGTANGSSSAAVLFDGTSGRFLSSVKTQGPVLSMAASKNGALTYVLEATTPTRTLFIFDHTLRGFAYHLDPKTISVVPSKNGSFVWVLQSDGLLRELSLIPFRTVRSVSIHAPAEALAVSPDGSLVYVLASSSHKKHVEVYQSSLSGHARISVPKGSSGLAVSASGTELFDSVSVSRFGLVLVIPL